MSGHNIIQELGQTLASYVGDADLQGIPLFVVNAAPPVDGTSPAAWLWLATNSDSLTTRLYVLANRSTPSWNALD